MSTRIISFGAGQMARALLLPLNSFAQLVFYSPSGESARALALESGGDTLVDLNNIEKEHADYYFICCKPQQFPSLALAIKDKLPKESVLVSLMAGISSAKIKLDTGHEQIIRLMPNTPCILGNGIILYYQENKNDKTEQLIKILEQSAFVLKMDSESQLDQVTSVAGSGPAYLFEWARILQASLEEMGLGSKDSCELISTLFLGSAKMMAENKDFTKLREQVTSKGGVTFAALEQMRNDSMEAMIGKALQANIKRSAELGSEQ